MANILVQKDANNLIAKYGISDSERTTWALDYTIYDVNADGSKGAAYGPTRAKLNRAGSLNIDAYGAPKISPTGDSAASLVSGAGTATILSIASPNGTDVGDVLSAQLSTGWTVTGYQWTRDGVDIAGATSSTYTLTSADAGKAIGVRGSGANYTSSITTAAPAFPPGQMYLDSLPLYIDSANLALA